MELKVRPWTTTEDSDICCHPLVASNFLWVEEDYAITQAGDKLEAVGDNLYRVTWNAETAIVHGEFTIYSSLHSALEYLG